MLILNFFVSLIQNTTLWFVLIEWYLNEIIIVGDRNLLMTTSPDNILSAGDPAEGYDLSAIAGPVRMRQGQR